MTQVLFAVFQEEMGVDELQGIVTSPEAALRWVEQLQQIYLLTHRDPIREEHEGEHRRWVALYAQWEIRQIPILSEAPPLVAPEHIQLAIRLLAQVDPKVQIEDLPRELQEAAQMDEIEAGPGSVAMGHDDEVGWFVLHVDPEIFYVIEVERHPGVETT